jgi:hypothetical protein
LKTLPEKVGGIISYSNKKKLIVKLKIRLNGNIPFAALGK